MTRSICHFTLLLWTIGGLSSCGPNYTWYQRHPIAPEGWAWEDTLHFTFSITDTTQVYDMWLELDHRPDYAYQNLYVKIHTSFPDGTHQSDLLSIEMADKQGRWQGQCQGNWCQLRIPIQQHIFFPQQGTYHVYIEQYMRKNPLSGITQIGMGLEALSQDRN